MVCTISFANDGLIAEAKESIKNQLKDPYSAVFENIYIGRAANGAPVVCGTVNAKNSYGAYVGRQAFYYHNLLKKRGAEIDGNNPAFHILFEAFCLKSEETIKRPEGK